MIDYIEYREDLQVLEGTADSKPNEADIIAKANEDGWNAFDVNIWFDTQMGFWRFDATIS